MEATPFCSAPSSPLFRPSSCCRNNCPSGIHASIHGPLIEDAADSDCMSSSSSSPSDFDFSARFSRALLSPGAPAPPPMSTAEELFSNGKIKPLNTKLQKLFEYNPYWSCANLHGVDDPVIADNHHSGIRRDYAEHHQQLAISKQSSIGPIAETALDQWKRKHLEKAESRHAKVHTYVERNHARGHNVGMECFYHVHAGNHAYNMRVESNHDHANAHDHSRGGGGHHRRARSLSPLRVFRMDGMVHPRPSFEGDMYTAFIKPYHTLQLPDNLAMDTKNRSHNRRSRKSWTLKELINMGDNRVHHDRRSSRVEELILSKDGGGNVEPPEVREKLGGNSAKSGSTSTDNWEGTQLHLAENVEGKPSLAGHANGNTRLRGHARPIRSPWGLQQQGMSGQAHHYYFGSQRAKLAEAMKKRTLLPYKRGLLGCLGLPSSTL